MIKHGIDMIEDVRIPSDEDFLKKVFHPSEIKKGKLASVFALKEAVFKALEITPRWLDVEIKYKKSGKTEIILSNKIKPKNLKSIDCSVSHEKCLTIASVVLQEKD
jgi:phosphopantetheine--protein transferase-like protein